jgi:hypothetical protein
MAPPQTDLNSFLDASAVSASWVLMRANSINDNGWIAGMRIILSQM